MIYDKLYVQSKAQTDSIGRQRWSHLYLQATGLTKYIQKGRKYIWWKIGFKIENESEDQN